jgi:predicted ArsR family transcriptional regulator
MNEERRCVNVQVSGPLRSAIVWLLGLKDRVSVDELALVAGIEPSRARAYLTSLAAGKIVRFKRDHARRSLRWAYWASDRPAKVRNRTRTHVAREERERLDWHMRCALQRSILDRLDQQERSILSVANEADVDDRRLHAFLTHGKTLPATDLLRVLRVILLDPLAAAGLDTTTT